MNDQSPAAIGIGMAEWREIPSLPGYFASSCGEILGMSGKVRSLKVCKRGYRWFGIANGKGGSSNVSVARAVCEAFHGAPIGRMDVDHINRERHDNRPANLRWVTRSENLRNRVCAHGERHYASRLTEDLVRQIRSASHYRGFDADFARQNGIARETVRDARLGKMWRNTK